MKAETNETKAEAVGRKDLWEQFKRQQKLGAIWLATREVDGNLIPSWEPIGREDEHSSAFILRIINIISLKSFPYDQLIKALKEAATPALLARKGNRDFTIQDIETVLLKFIDREGDVPEEGINEKTAMIVRGPNGGSIDEWHARIIQQLESSATERDPHPYEITQHEIVSSFGHNREFVNRVDETTKSTHSLESGISLTYLVGNSVLQKYIPFESFRPDWTDRIWLGQDPTICLEHDLIAIISGAESVSLEQAIQFINKLSQVEDAVDSNHPSREVTFEAGSSTLASMSRMYAITSIAQASSPKTDRLEQIDLANFVITTNQASDPLPTPAIKSIGQSLCDLSINQLIEIAVRDTDSRHAVLSELSRIEHEITAHDRDRSALVATRSATPPKESPGSELICAEDVIKELDQLDGLSTDHPLSPQAEGLQATLRRIAVKSFESLEENQSVVEKINNVLVVTGTGVVCPSDRTSSLLRCYQAGGGMPAGSPQFFFEHYEKDGDQVRHGGFSGYADLEISPRHNPNPKKEKGKRGRKPKVAD